MVYDPGIVFAAQGRKNVYLEGSRYDYEPGSYLALFAPLPVECEVTEASPKTPLLGAGLYFDQNRLARLLLKMESIEQQPLPNAKLDPSAVFTSHLDSAMLDAIVRLLKTLRDPREAAILGPGIIEEIYYRFLNNWQGGGLIHLLQLRGQIKEDFQGGRTYSSESRPGFNRRGVSRYGPHEPLGVSQKIQRGHAPVATTICEVDQAQSRTELHCDRHVRDRGGIPRRLQLPAQFSREYKRHFGVAPSEHKRGDRSDNTEPSLLETRPDTVRQVPPMPCDRSMNIRSHRLDDAPEIERMFTAVFPESEFRPSSATTGWKFTAIHKAYAARRIAQDCRSEILDLQPRTVKNSAES